MAKLSVSPQIASDVQEETERDTENHSISSARPGAGWEKGSVGTQTVCVSSGWLFLETNNKEKTAPSLSHSAQPLLRGKERGRRRAHV